MTRREQLIREQHETWTRMQEIMQRAEAEGRDLTAEESTNWDSANTRLDQIDGELRRLDTMAARETVDRSQVLHTGGQPADPEGEARSPEQTAQEYRAAWNTWLREGQGPDSGLTTRQRELLAANRTETRALGQGTPQAGGYLVPPDIRTQVVEVIESFGGMLQFCNRITTATGAPMSWPVSDDTMNEGIEIAENTQVSERDLEFTDRTIGSHIYTSRMVRVPWSLLEDEAFDLEGFLVRKFGERIGRIYARRLLTGSGVGQPTGLLQAARIGAEGGLIVGATSPVGATPSLTFDGFIDLEHSIDPAYRNGGRARYGFSDGALKIARKVKDGDGRYIWQPAVLAGQQATLNGYPYFVDNTMADPVANGIGAVFGDFFAGMLVREVQAIQNVQLRERYADFMQTGFFAYSRMDACPDDNKALAALQFGAAS